ncbi:alpha-ribazole phosphatase [Desulfotomaculum nigrificans]|uniref:alpha-ribazole phosphatase n=1 Tax=Desulfotomaculum nigrificans TaxID=1565 RepID=UPI0001FADE05|nr:alpha-ribazole phosphatase [Desulfotomaculum nigrificans]
MKTMICLVRHGETVWNSNGKFQGHTDVPLSDVGREQARALALRLSQEKIDAFYSSDLARARETAEILANPHNKSVGCLSDLREINFGQWEGLTIKEISERFGEIISKWWNDPLSTQIPSGEKLQDVVIRCNKALNEIVTKHAGETVVIVTHGGAIRTIVASVLGLDLKNYAKLRMDNVSLTILEYYEPGKAILKLYNDTCHLRCKK